MNSRSITNELIANASENELRNLVTRLRDLNLSTPPQQEVPQTSTSQPQYRPQPSSFPIKSPKSDTYDGQRNNHILNT